MAQPGMMGLTRKELEYEVQWHMRKAPKEPGKMPEFLTELIVLLIEKNNEAVAAALAEQDRQDLPEGA